MSWTSPRTYVDDEILTAAILNADIRDNLLALDTHGHDGTSGDGAATLTSLDEVQWDHQATLGAGASGHSAMWIESGGTVRVHNAGGSELTLSTTDHTHSLAEVQTVEEVVNTPAAPSTTTGAVSISTSMITVESATITVGGAGKNAIVITGVFTAWNLTGNSDGHTCRARLVWDSVEVLITSYSASITDNEKSTFVLTHLEPDVAAGSKTGTIQAQRSGGTGNLSAYYQGLALLEADD